jgi:hypothetical protein
VTCAKPLSATETHREGRILKVGAIRGDFLKVERWEFYSFLKDEFH